jgi:YbbR domain-containing protein
MKDTKSGAQPPARHPWLEDAGSAVLALLLALVIWIVAVIEQDPPKVDTFAGVPVQYVNRGANLVAVGKVEDRVQVELRAPDSRWSTLNPDIVQATVDLAGLGEGVHSVDVQVRSLDKSVSVVTRTPARVVVRLEESISRDMDVHVVVADPDSAPLGYAVMTPVAAPQKVTVSGARSLVESLTDVEARVWLRGSKTTQDMAVTPVPLDAQGNVVSGVDVAPVRTQVTLGVEPRAEFQEVTVKAVLKGQPLTGYWVSNITVEPAAVTLQGKPDIVRTLAAVVSTQPIDISGVKETVSKRVPLVLPEGVSVYSADTSGQTVLVKVEITAIQGGKTVQPKVEITGLRAGLTAVASPDTVDVILSGPMPDLQGLQPDDVRVVVSVLGLQPGRHKITPTVVLPEGSPLKVESIAPDTIEVVITASTTPTAPASSTRGSP